MSIGFVSSLSLGAVIGVAVASGVVLCTIVLVTTVLILRRQKKRALVELERDLRLQFRDITGCDIEEQQASAHDTRCLSESDGSSVNNRPSREDDPSERKTKGHKRKPSEILSWPLPRRRSSKRGLSIRTMIAPRLSAVIESPRSFAPGASFGPGPVEYMDPSTRHIKISTPPSQSLRRPLAMRVAPATCPPARRSRNALANGRGLAHPSNGPLQKPDRSFSLPTMLASLPDDAVFGTSIRATRPAEPLRSISYGTLMEDGDIADQTPTYLESPLLRFHNPRPKLDRNISNLPTHTIQSVSSSTLRLAEFDFNYDAPNGRNPASTIGGRAQFDERDIVLEKLSAVTGLPLREVVEKCSPAISTKKPSAQKEHASGIATIGQTYTADSVRLSKIFTNCGQPAAAAIIRVSSTPKRNSQLRQVSACGSPLEKLKASVLRDISGNELMPSRELSETSMLSLSSQGNSNPFKWESPVQLRPSVLKGSPTSKKGRQRGSATVRIASTPIIHSLPQYSSCSLLSAGLQEDIPEDDSLGSESSDCNTSNLNRVLPRPPSVPVFAPELKPKALNFRASLTPSSPTLSCNPYQQDFDMPLALNVQRSPQKGLIDPLRSAPTERAMAENSYISFPLPPFSMASETKDAVFEDVPLDIVESDPVPADSPTIPPGLTLFAKRQNLKLDTASGKAAAAASIRARKEEIDQVRTTIVDAAGSSESLARRELPAYTFPQAPPESMSTEEFEHCNKSSLDIRRTPLSSIVDPSNTDPDTCLPLETSPRKFGQPLGPRPAPAQPLMKSIKELRRENSEAHHSISESREVRRYMRPDRQGSPILRQGSPILRQGSPILRQGSPLLGAAHLMSEISDTLDGEIDIEDGNDSNTGKRISVWEDGEEFWNGASPGSKKASAESRLPRPVAGPRNLSPKQKRPSRVVKNKPQSFYDTAGFLKAQI